MLNKSRKQSANQCSTWRIKFGSWLATSLLICLICYGSLPLAFAQSGNIASFAIEIDKNANLFRKTQEVK